MSKRIRRAWTKIHIELNISYPFPTISILLVIFIIVGAFSVLNHINIDAHLSSGVTDSEARITHLYDVVNHKAVAVFLASTANYVYVFMVVIPLLVAFSFAQGYSSGLIRTLLSYPFSRRDVLFIKSGTVFMLVGGSASIGAFVNVLFFVPIIDHLEYFFLALISVWALVLLMTAVSTLLVVITRNALATSFGAITIWFLAYVFITMPDTSIMTKILLFPPFAVARYTGSRDFWLLSLFPDDVLLMNLFTGMLFTGLIACALFGLSYIIFKRTGV